MFFAIKLILITMLTGCTATSIGANAGITAFQERTVENIAYDLKLKMKIYNEWVQFDSHLLLNAGIEVYESRVLLTGVVDTPEIRSDAVRLIWKIVGVKDVINEIQVATSNGIIDKVRDTWISTQLKTKLTLDKKIYAINYIVKTIAKIVYIIGTAQNKEELGRVISHARNIEYVRKVINHVRIKGKI